MSQINEIVLIVVGASVLELARTIDQEQNLSRKGRAHMSKDMKQFVSFSKCGGFMV